MSAATSKPPVTLRVDPWAPDYDASLQIEEAGDEEVAPVDVTVERAAWQAGTPGGGPTPPAARRLVYGFFGSAAVGAAHLDARAEITDVLVERLIVMGGGLAPGNFTIA